jgi:Zn/Cd-binding protein ZinT
MINTITPAFSRERSCYERNPRQGKPKKTHTFCEGIKKRTCHQKQCGKGVVKGGKKGNRGNQYMNAFPYEFKFNFFLFCHHHLPPEQKIISSR